MNETFVVAPFNNTWYCVAKVNHFGSKITKIWSLIKIHLENANQESNTNNYSSKIIQLLCCYFDNVSSSWTSSMLTLYRWSLKMSVLITIFLTTIDIYIVHCANRHSQWRLSLNFIISVISLQNRIGLDDLFGNSKFASKNGAKQLYYRSDIRKSASHWHMIDGRQTLCPN